MKTTTQTRRRRPRQRRAQLTVEAMLDAVARILARDGVEAVTTNRIAEVAGVSIGSVYQYFPDKRAIFVAVHQRHVERIARLVEATLVEHAAASLDVLVRAMIGAMVAAHQEDAELNEALWAEVPHRAEASRDVEARHRGAWRLVLAARSRELRPGRDLGRVVFFLADMVLALVHSVTARPARMSLANAKEEAVRAVLAFVRA